MNWSNGVGTNPTYVVTDNNIQYHTDDAGTFQDAATSYAAQANPLPSNRRILITRYENGHQVENANAFIPSGELAGDDGG